MTIPSDRVLQFGTTNRSGDKPRCCGAAPKCWRPPLNQDTTSTSDLHHALPILNLFFSFTSPRGWGSLPMSPMTGQRERAGDLRCCCCCAYLLFSFYHLAERGRFLTLPMLPMTGQRERAGDLRCCCCCAYLLIFTTSPRGRFLPLPMSPMTGQFLNLSFFPSTRRVFTTRPDHHD